MPSAIATTNIFPGAAVAQSKGTASLAGGSVVASHVVNAGAAARGVVSMVDSGEITLNDWTLATGGKQLSTGATYFVASLGKLSTSGSQPVGIAISPFTLLVNIQSQGVAGSSGSVSPSVISQIALLQAQVNTVAGNIPSIYSGTAAIPNGVNSGTVAGLEITAFAPSRAILTVRCPIGGLAIFATVIDTTISLNGFQFLLSSVTDSANYKLDFVLTP